jgi:hypothetical protein
MSKNVRWLNKKEAEFLGFKPKENDGKRNQNRYSVEDEDYHLILSKRNKPKKRKFVKTIEKFDKNGVTLSSIEKLQSKPIPIPDNFEVVRISTSKTTGQQWVIATPRKETPAEVVESFDFKGIIEKYIIPLSHLKEFNRTVSKLIYTKDFDTLTVTDVHIGMEPDVDNNTMYVKDWNKEELIKSADAVIIKTIQEQESNVLYVDDLGDLLDGFNAQTTRGGHALPQNMTNEQCFDAALEFKLKILYGLVNIYDKIHFNNICNDNHSGAFGYFVNESFKQIAEIQFKDKVTVTNHRKFINHYFVGDICFLISHGKDDKSLKFGFKPQLDLKGADKIDQYCKQYGIYKTAKLIIFKKGDSHQALFDMCTSDDFYYFNYPALSPSSNWIKNNFKLGRRGFVNESFKGLKNYLKPNFITN